MENRIFIPGSEWVYFKIYTGTKTADSILKNELFGYVREMLGKDIIDKWFFIRYSDPDFHLRLRLHLKSTRDFNSIFSRFFEIFYPIVDNGFIWSIQCETYRREMERYGGNSISHVEELFFMDSEFVINLLHHLSGDNQEHQRWKLALLMIDNLLSVFSYDLLKRKELLITISESYKKEFGFTYHDVSKQLNYKYRIYRKEIENAVFSGTEFSKTNEIFQVYKLTISPVVKLIIDMDKSGDLPVALDKLVTSIIHMSMNRWFRSRNRLNELVIYSFLSKYYSSKYAKLIHN